MLSERAKSGEFSINVRAKNWAERKKRPGGREGGRGERRENPPAIIPIAFSKRLLACVASGFVCLPSERIATSSQKCPCDKLGRAQNALTRKEHKTTGCPGYTYKI